MFALASAIARPRRNASRLPCPQCSHDASYLLVDHGHSGEDQHHRRLGHGDASGHHLLCRQCSQDASYLLVEDTDRVTEPEPLVSLDTGVVRLVSRKALRAQTQAARWTSSRDAEMIWIQYNPDSASHVGDTVAAAVNENQDSLYRNGSPRGYTLVAYCTDSNFSNRMASSTFGAKVSVGAKQIWYMGFKRILDSPPKVIYASQTPFVIQGPS